MTGTIFMVLGLCFGILVQVGGGILAGVFNLTPWMTVWWGAGATVYTIVKDYWLPGGKMYGNQPRWMQGVLLTMLWGTVLWTAVNYVLYLVLHLIFA